MLTAFLDYYRAALLDRTFGLDQQQLATPLAPSSLTIGGLIGHMTFVEYVWYRVRFAGHDMPEPFASLDWDENPDAEMALAESWPTEHLLEAFDEAIRDSRQQVKNAASLDDLSELNRNSDREKWNLRWIMIHMIEEYARHCGHADLIRESIDGDVCQ